MEPLWNELSGKLQGRVTVAHVDVYWNTGLKTRFSIRDTPTILFIRKGRFYKYEGPIEIDNLVAFATEEYE